MNPQLISIEMQVVKVQLTAMTSTPHDDSKYKAVIRYNKRNIEFETHFEKLQNVGQHGEFVQGEIDWNSQWVIDCIESLTDTLTLEILGQDYSYMGSTQIAVSEIINHDETHVTSWKEAGQVIFHQGKDSGNLLIRCRM
jgi:hypothetical protein